MNRPRPLTFVIDADGPICLEAWLVEVGYIILTCLARWHLQQYVGAIEGIEVTSLGEFRLKTCNFVFKVSHNGARYLSRSNSHAEASAFCLSSDALATGW